MISLTKRSNRVCTMLSIGNWTWKKKASSRLHEGNRMATRKLQKDIDIIFKKIQEGLHDFNYHYDRYESINTDEDSDNQREKEKLENDLKKEIKRLQKFREQIKIWQLNDVIKSMALSSNALSNKLMENKKLIEEAMEVYKNVERSSKLKTFSNQSILMASMDQQNTFDDDSSGDDSDIYARDGDFFESGNEQETEDFNHLSPETVDAIKFLQDILAQLNELSKKLTAEYEKLAHKKLRKNNLSTIEAKKEKITTAKDSNKFHLKKISKVLKLLKANKIPDLNLVWIIKEDLVNYLASNTDAKEVDNNLYDDILNLNSFDNEYDYNDSEILENQSIQKPSAGINLHGDGTSTPIANQSNGTNGYHSQKANTSSIPASPVNKKTASPEMASPAIIKILKPASTPSKPVGGLKWSAAAAVGLPSNSNSSNSTAPASSASTAATSEVPSEVSTIPTTAPLSAAATIASSNSNNNERTEVPKFKKVVGNDDGVIEDDSNSKFEQVLKNSTLSKIELNVFSDMNLYKLPPGIQDLILSFTSKRNESENFSLLYDSTSYNQYVTPIYKPYLPAQIQPFHGKTKTDSFKVPLLYLKLQSYWNKIRANNQFEQLANEIESIQQMDNVQQHQSTQEEIINELTSVFFFGYYHALTPMENLIAESYLFKLGWKPYKSRTGTRSPGPGAFRFNEIGLGSQNYLYWFKCIKLLPVSTEEPRVSEFGDYQVFDLSTWDYFVKIGFNFEYELSQTEPSKLLC